MRISKLFFQAKKDGIRESQERPSGNKSAPLSSDVFRQFGSKIRQNEAERREKAKDSGESGLQHL